MTAMDQGSNQQRSGGENSRALFEEAVTLLPAGVNSPVRAFRRVGGLPFFVREAAGAFIRDVDGREFIDLVGAYGPLLLGHAHPHVTAAVCEAVRRGATFGTPHPGEVTLARKLAVRFPAIEMVRLVSTGTEATMTALRLARAATGRSRIVKFEGCYHGHFDGLLVRAGSGAATFGVPDSAGVPGELAALTLSLPFNDLSALEAVLAAQGHEIAAVIVEPVAGNMGVAAPLVGYLEGLRRACTKAGALLIFDEVITGLRIGPAGAQGLYGVVPDLSCLGKVLGGGLPLAAVGGRRDLMQQLAPLGPVYQAGTFSGNPVSVAAALAVLDVLESAPGLYDELEGRAARLEAAIHEAAQEAGVRYAVSRVGSMFSLLHGRPRLIRYEDAVESARGPYPELFRRLLAEGVFVPPSPLETCFLSTAHDDAVIDRLAAAFKAALGGLPRAPAGDGP